MKIIIRILYLSLVITACNNTKKTAAGLTEKQEDTKVNAEETMLQQSGVDFFGEGSVPVNWQLQMNYDDTVRFSAEDGLSLKIAYNQLKKNTQQNAFSAKVSNGELQITVNDETCTIPTHREVYHKGVTVAFNGRSYTGCGKFLADRMLNNKWILDKIGNIPIRAEDYNKIPVLQLDAANQKVSGNDGCNSIGGKIEVQGNRIQFGPLVTTRMACIKKDISAIIGALVSGKLVSYYFKGGELYLYLPDDSLLVFKKG